MQVMSVIIMSDNVDIFKCKLILTTQSVIPNVLYPYFCEQILCTYTFKIRAFLVKDVKYFQKY